MTVGSSEKSRKLENVEEMVEIGEKIENAWREMFFSMFDDFLKEYSLNFFSFFRFSYFSNFGKFCGEDGGGEARRKFVGGKLGEILRSAEGKISPESCFGWKSAKEGQKIPGISGFWRGRGTACWSRTQIVCARFRGWIRPGSRCILKSCFSTYPHFWG